MNKNTKNEELDNSSNRPHRNELTEINNKLKLETMSTEMKNEELVNENQPHNFKKRDLITLILSEGNYKSGGRLLKGDKISNSQRVERFYSGTLYFFIKREGDKVLLQYFCGGFPSESYVWVDISEIHHPYGLKNNGLEKECEEDSVTYCVDTPKPFNYTFEDFKKYCDNKNYIYKYKTDDGEVYNTRKDVPNYKGCSYFEIPLPITDFDLLKWKSFLKEFQSMSPFNHYNFEEEINNLIKRKIESMISEKHFEIVQQLKKMKMKNKIKNEELTQINNKLKLETMSTKTTNEELMKGSNQPQIREFYKMLNENKVLSLKDVLNYNWIREIDSKKEVYKIITDNGRLVIWELPDRESTIDTMFSYTDIESEIYEIISENDNLSVDEILDIISDEYLDRVEDYLEKQIVDSYTDIDINKISNYFLSINDVKYFEDYNNCVSDIKNDFLDRINRLVNTKYESLQDVNS